MSNLKACPFCGYEHPAIRIKSGFVYVTCEQCQIEFSNDCTCGRNRNEDKTITAWNRRVVFDGEL